MNVIPVKRAEHGAALPLVLLMTVLLGLALAATSILTQSAEATVAVQARERQQRTELVNWALARAIEDLSPSSGRMLGIDPQIDPAGSCVGRLADPGRTDYKVDEQRSVRVDCAQAPNSGWRTSLSSLLLVGDGSDCAGSCVTGRDGGLQLSSNDPLTFAGTLINLAGAWLGKNANAKLLQGASEYASVVQPTANSECPALANNGTYLFESNPRCACPAFASTQGSCSSRTFAQLSSDIQAFMRAQSSALTAYVPTGLAQIPSCSSASRLNPNDATSPWALVIDGGRVGPTELAKLNALTDGKQCVGDGTSKQTPILVLTGVMRFEDLAAGSPMRPGQAPSASNTWTINSATATVVAGSPLMNATNTAVTDCQRGTSGAMLQFAGSTYLHVSTGRLMLCPIATDGVVIAAPIQANGVGFTWTGIRTEALLSTQYGLASGETFKIHGLVFAPAAYFKIDSQSNRTLVSFDGGTVLRGLSLTSNPSTVTQGEFSIPNPTATGRREVQLRFWDVGRNRSLGFVDMVIDGDYPAHPAASYVFSVWRTLW